MSVSGRSLTARLAALFALSSCLLLLAFGSALYWASDQHFIEQDAHDLHGRAQIIGNLVARYDATTLPEALDAVLISHHELALLLLDATQQPIYQRSPEVFAAALAREASGEAERRAEHGGVLVSFEYAGHHWRALSLQSTAAGAGYKIWLAIAIDHHREFLDRLLYWLLLGGGLAALLSAALGVWIARRGLKPLQKISTDATLISAQHLSTRLDAAKQPRELQPLIRELNAMLGRLDDAFQRLTEFSSDIAHEFRTPINNLMTQTGVTLSRVRDDAAYREVLASNLEEYERLSRMIADMLFLARADHGLVVPEPGRVDLAEQADALCSFYEALAEEKRLTLKRSGEARVAGDPLMLRRALANLISNAIRHAAAGTTVRIELSKTTAGTEIAIVNRGETIPSDELPRLFDRFYRGDFARQRGNDPASEGSGLGLGIVKSIVEAHHGKISVFSTNGETRFCIGLP